MKPCFPRVVLLGRPNVGKSTLFNRLIRSNRAITHDRPGITRDRMEGIVRSREQSPFYLVDTGGLVLDGHARLEEGPEGIRGFERDILEQAAEAVREADLLCLVADARDGLLPLDRHLADYLRRLGKVPLLVVNKVDGPEKADLLLAEFHELGLETIPCSAAHGFNIRGLEEELRERIFPDASDVPPEHFTVDARPDTAGPGHPAADAKREGDFFTGPLRLCLLGRPNAGKSSLVNALTGERRMIVSPVAGTTRDSVDVSATINGEPCTFVDTAGVRRRARITDTVERYSVNSALKSTTKAHVTMLVLDASGGLALQDKRLINLLHERRTPFMLLVNKCDLIEQKERRTAEKLYRETLSFCPHVPVLFVSARNGHDLQKIVPLALELRRECGLRVSTGQLNRAMSAVLVRHQPPISGRTRARFFYLTQAESHPPTFVFFVNDADKVPDSYSRYLERSLRSLFGILHAPLRIHFRSAHGKKSGRHGRPAE